MVCFIGRGYDNKTRTLDFGGSDFTATIYAAILNAKIVHIWSDRMKEKGYDSFDDITPSDILDLVNSLWNLLVNHFINQFGLRVKYNP